MKPQIEAVGLFDGAVINIKRGRKILDRLRLGPNDVHAIITRPDGVAALLVAAPLAPVAHAVPAQAARVVTPNNNAFLHVYVVLGPAQGCLFAMIYALHRGDVPVCVMGAFLQDIHQLDSEQQANDIALKLCEGEAQLGYFPDANYTVISCKANGPHGYNVMLEVSPE